MRQGGAVAFAISKSMASSSPSSRTSPTLRPPPNLPPLPRLPPFPQRPSPHCLPTSIALEGSLAPGAPRSCPREPLTPDPPEGQRLRCVVLATKCVQSALVGFLPSPTKRPPSRSLIRTVFTIDCTQDPRGGISMSFFKVIRGGHYPPPSQEEKVKT